MASEHVSLIMRIIKDKKNMNDIMHEKPNIGRILNFNERPYRQSLNKKFITRINKSMIFNVLKR